MAESQYAHKHCFLRIKPYGWPERIEFALRIVLNGVTRRNAFSEIGRSRFILNSESDN